MSPHLHVAALHLSQVNQGVDVGVPAARERTYILKLGAGAEAWAGLKQAAVLGGGTFFAAVMLSAQPLQAATAHQTPHSL